MTGEITWRKYRQSEIYYRDLDAVVRLHSETEQALGMRMDLPDFMDKPVLEAWVAERDGVVVGGMYLEAVVEPVMFGRDPEVSASARRFAPVLFERMAKRGFRMVRMEVPHWIGQDAKAIGRELLKVGFVPTDKEFLHYRFDLRQPVIAGGNGHSR